MRLLRQCPLRKKSKWKFAPSAILTTLVSRSSLTAVVELTSSTRDSTFPSNLYYEDKEDDVERHRPFLFCKNIPNWREMLCFWRKMLFYSSPVHDIINKSMLIFKGAFKTKCLKKEIS